MICNAWDYLVKDWEKEQARQAQMEIDAARERSWYDLDTKFDDPDYGIDPTDGEPFGSKG